MPRVTRRLLLLLVAVVALAACGGSSSSAEAEPGSSAEAESSDGIRVVSPTEAASVIEAAPEGLVVLDVRTQPEFDEVRLADAILIDINQPGFAERVAELDRDAPVVMYCRSGNRSAAARDVLDELGFTDVVDVDGGILDWVAAGLPVERS